MTGTVLVVDDEKSIRITIEAFLTDAGYKVDTAHDADQAIEKLEKNGRGLNLTWEVRDGILNHSKTGVEKLFGQDWGKVGSFEGEICKIADMIAYINHDIGDAIRAELITEEDLPEPASKVLGHSHSERINTMVGDIVAYSWGVSGPARGEVEIGVLFQPFRVSGHDLNAQFTPDAVGPQYSPYRQIARLRRARAS